MAGKTTNATGSLRLTAVVDGTTLSPRLMSTLPLSQAFKTNKDEVTPDFKKDPNTRPSIYLLVSDISTGQYFSNDDLSPNLTWFYNQEIITFGDNGINTNEHFPGLFQKTTITKNNKVVPAITVIDNFPQYGHYDNDIISANASVEIAGTQIWMKDVSIEVEVKELAGALYALQIDDENSFIIPADESVKQTVSRVKLLQDNVEVAADKFKELGARFIWEKTTSNGITQLAVGDTLTITKDMINHVLNVRCRCEDKGGNLLASAYVYYTDASDTYIVDFEKTLSNGKELVGEALHRGETAVIKAYMRTKDNSARIENVTWHFNAYNNNGEPYDDKKPMETLNDIVRIPYDTVVNNGMGLLIVADGEVTL